MFPLAGFFLGLVITLLGHILRVTGLDLRHLCIYQIQSFIIMPFGGRKSKTLIKTMLGTVQYLSVGVGGGCKFMNVWSLPKMALFAHLWKISCVIFPFLRNHSTLSVILALVRRESPKIFGFSAIFSVPCIPARLFF